MEKELFGAGAGRRRFKLDVKDRGYHGLGILSSIYFIYILIGFMFDLGFLGVEKTFLNKNHHYLSRRKKVEITAEQKKSTTRTILQRG